MNEQQKPNTITDIIKPELPNLVAILSLNSDKETAMIQVLALQELNYLEQHATNNQKLLQCDQNSIILAVKNVLRKNLSLDPDAGLVYVKTRNINIGTYEKPVWKTVMETQETVNGKISYNRQIGRLYDYKRPKIFKDASGKVIGGEVELQTPGFQGQPRWETYDYDESDIERWRRFSHVENSKGYKQNSGKEAPDLKTLNWANKLYTSWKGGPDPEFIRAKILRHSLKKLGSNSNEGVIIIPPAKYAQAVDAKMAMMEAEEDNLHDDFAQHEELNSTINETQATSRSNTPSTDTFNPEDL